jgi:hypothetical protein
LNTNSVWERLGFSENEGSGKTLKNRAGHGRNLKIYLFSSSRVKPLPLDFSTLDEWWELKDRTVKLHANLEHLEYFWKNKLLSQDKHDVAILSDILNGIFLSCSIISKTCSKDILDLVSGILDKQPSLLSNYVKAVLPSSPWIGMYQLKNKIDQPKECKKIIQQWVLPMPVQKYGSEYSMIADYLTDLRHCSEAIEDGVDFVFHEFIKK